MTTRLRGAAKMLGEAAIVLVALWSVGAMFGVVAVGFCMVAGCR